MTAVTSEQMRAKLALALQPTFVEVIDESAQHAGHAGADASGSGTHFRVRVASPLFSGKSRVAQHRLVYDAVFEFIVQGVHALAIETLSLIHI